MTFKEIPHFTRPGNWQVEMDLETLVDRIAVLEQEGFQLNPDFQRGHVWTQEQQTAFVEYLLRGGTSGRTLYFNHPGWMGSFEGEFVCVDGLQRITAIQRFINNEIKAFGQYYSEFSGHVDRLHHCMQVNVNNLQTKREVLQWYVEMNSGGTPHSQAEIDRVRAMMEQADTPQETEVTWHEQSLSCIPCPE